MRTWILFLILTSVTCISNTALAGAGGGPCTGGANHDCQTPGGPGCTDQTCCEAVCACDPFCCTTQWDAYCAGDGFVPGCGADVLCVTANPACGAAANHDCSTLGSPGCTDEACCNAVCSVDPFCCSSNWDDICAGEAQGLCGGGNIDPRAQYTFKGDLFVWPYVVIVWNNNGTPSSADDVVLQDVFITLTNDDICPHNFRMQFVDGMDCLDFDRQIQLTNTNPVYFSAYNGQGGGFSGDPNGSIPSFRGINTQGDPLDPLNPNIRFIGGYIVGWTVNAEGLPIRTNQLVGGATVVDYRIEQAWEYKAWSYRSLWENDGKGKKQALGLVGGCDDLVKPGDPSLLSLDGFEYETTPSVLLLDFFATGSPAFGPSALAPIVASTSDFELTLLTAKFHFEAQPDFDNNGVFRLPNDDNDCVLDSEPAIGGVDVLSFNEDEQPVSETVHCVQCWDSTLGSLYGFQGEESPFALALLGTDKGYARIRGVLDARCDRAGQPNGNPPVRCIQSQDLPLLGIAHKIIRWGAGNTRVTKAESHLTAAGSRPDGFVRTNPPLGQPPTSFLPAAGTTGGSGAKGSVAGSQPIKTK